MAGLIQESMGAEAPQQAAPGMMPPEDQAMMQQAGGAMMEEPESDEPLDEENPGFKAALKIVLQGLYEAGAAEDVLAAINSAPDRVEGLASTTYEMIAVATENSEPEIDAEYLPLLGITVLGEIAEIAEAGGNPFKASELAQALKQMVLRMLQEAGADTAELQAAMEQVDPSAFDAAAEAPEEPEEEMQ